MLPLKFDTGIFPYIFDILVVNVHPGPRFQLATKTLGEEKPDAAGCCRMLSDARARGSR